MYAPRQQSYAPTPYGYTPTSSLSATINLDEQVKLSTTSAERDLYESLAEIYSILITLDALEKAFLKDSIIESDYTETCSRLLKQYKSNLADETVSRAFVDLENFKREWQMECPRATERIRVGIPATVEQPTHKSAPQGGGAAATLIVAASENFITLLDAVKIGMVSKDALHPILVETIQAVNKVTGEFENKEKIVQWLIILNQMRAAEELNQDQARELQFDMEHFEGAGKNPGPKSRQKTIAMFQNEHVEELRSVLDLPQLYQKPSLRTLRETLYLLAVKPRSFEGLAAPLVHPKGLSNYLTGIVGSRLSWIQDESEKEIIWELASQRLSERSGRSGMASMTRSFSIPAASGAFDIRLHEPSLTEDNLGLKTWSSSFTLATRLHLLKLPSDALEGTILELGAGTGLVGLAASAMLQREVILTDLSVIELNLSKNIEINAGTLQTHNGSARSGVLDWTNPGMLRMRSSEDTPGLQLQSNTAVTLPNIGATSVESCCSRVASAMIILAADPIYSPDHPKLLVGTILTWLCKHNQARVILAYPLREAYAPQISELRQSLQLGGLTPIEEGTELAMDDWAEEVEHSWSVWAWKKVK